MTSISKDEWPSAPDGSWHLVEIAGGLSFLMVCFGRIGNIFYGTRQWLAMCEWLRFHNLDPDQIPIDEFIYRNENMHRVVTRQFKKNEDGKFPILRKGTLEIDLEVVSEQGEAGPLPWPDILGTPRPLGVSRCTEKCMAEIRNGSFGDYHVDANDSGRRNFRTG